MPGISGFETAQLIRQRKSTEHIPIIFVTAISTSETHLFKGYSLGAVDYIFTPVIPDVLRSKVNVFVELLKKTEEAKRQAEQLRLLEEREHRQRLSEAARRLELQTKQNRFFTLSVDLLAIADFAGHLKELNAAWERLLGYSENDLKGNPFWEWMDPAEKEIAQSRLREAIQDRNTVNFECSYRCRDGSNRWFAWHLLRTGQRNFYIFLLAISLERKSPKNRSGNLIRLWNSARKSCNRQTRSCKQKFPCEKKQKKRFRNPIRLWRLFHIQSHMICALRFERCRDLPKYCLRITRGRWTKWDVIAPRVLFMPRTGWTISSTIYWFLVALGIPLLS